MRLPDWPQRLAAAQAAALGRDHELGVHDCALHAAACALAVTGRDLAAPFQGRYATYAGGLALLKAESGARSLRAWADGLWSRVPPAMAQTGDWALVKAPTAPDGKLRPVLMVVDHAALRGAAGDRMARSAAEVCWRVE